MRNLTCLIFFVFSTSTAFAQSAWPASNWDVATNLTNLMSSSGVEGLSGVHYNPTKNQLYLVQDVGRLRVIQFNNQSGNHLQLTDRNLGGDLEGITQVNDNDNEFWVIQENEHLIARYQYNANFSTVTLLRSYDLLSMEGGMFLSGNGGPEDICFIPDEFLQAAGFVSAVTGLAYSSQKGMGGLMFIAHQNQGKIWVYDINPDVNNDLFLVGVYNTNRQESCGLSFDRSTGLLYILHNIDNNYLEVSDLKVNQTGQNFKFNLVQEFNVSVPTNGGKNIEGVALRPKCDDPESTALWLVRDVSGSQSVNALKEFRPFGLLGSCALTVEEETRDNRALIYPNPNVGLLCFNQTESVRNRLEVFDSQGRLLLDEQLNEQINCLNIDHLISGVYWVKLNGKSVKMIKL